MAERANSKLDQTRAWSNRVECLAVMIASDKIEPEIIQTSMATSASASASASASMCAYLFQVYLYGIMACADSNVFQLYLCVGETLPH